VRCSGYAPALLEFGLGSLTEGVVAPEAGSDLVGVMSCCG
jgi:hypothetical protein